MILRKVLELTQQRYKKSFILINAMSITIFFLIPFSKDGMFGGIATWDRENKSFIIHKSGEIFRLTNKLIIEITFGEQGLHPRVILST